MGQVKSTGCFTRRWNDGEVFVYITMYSLKYCLDGNISDKARAIKVVMRLLSFLLLLCQRIIHQREDVLYFQRTLRGSNLNSSWYQTQTRTTQLDTFHPLMCLWRYRWLNLQTWKSQKGLTLLIFMWNMLYPLDRYGIIVVGDANMETCNSSSFYLLIFWRGTGVLCCRLLLQLSCDLFTLSQ